jgi:DNA repair protein RecO (recombination protein O)
MQERATGLILRTHPLTETSLIIHWLSAEAGRVATVAKGARRPKSAFRGKLDLYFLAEFSFVRSRRSELHNLCEVVLRDTLPQLRRDLGWLRQAAYAASLIEQLTETDTPLPEVFSLLLDFLQQLPRQPATPRSVFAFELKLLAELGWQPDWQRERLSAGAKALLAKLPGLDWPEIACLHFSPAQTSEASHFLKYFIAHHCERVPKKRDAALAG